MSKEYNDKNIKWDIENRLSLQFPKEVNVDWSRFTEPKFTVDKKTGKITIEIFHKEIPKDNS